MPFYLTTAPITPSNQQSIRSNFALTRQVHQPSGTAKRRLTLKGEAGSNLVASLVELLGIEGPTNAKGKALVDLYVVGEGEDAAVVDLGLSFPSEPTHLIRDKKRG